jgi:hypothetical protein
MKQTTQQRLREALSARNILPIELSRLSGIGKSAISQYLSGKVTPKQDKIYKLAQALKVNESWLMGYDEPMEQSPAPALGDLPTVSPTGQKIDARTRRQLEKVLDDDNLTYNGIVLDGDDKEKVKKALELIFWDAKEKNKRKKE